MKFYRDHIERGKYTNSVTGEVEYSYYFYFVPNWLPKEVRHWGYQVFWYDGTHAAFGFWFFNFSWSTPWTKCKWE